MVQTLVVFYLFIRFFFFTVRFANKREAATSPLPDQDFDNGLYDEKTQIRTGDCTEDAIGKAIS